MLSYTTLFVFDVQEDVLEGQVSTAEEKFYGNIYMLEIERAKYMLKSYLRARLAKVRIFMLLQRLKQCFVK